MIDAADVHVARRLGRLGGERDETVLLAVALAVRAPAARPRAASTSTVRDDRAVDLDETAVDLARAAVARDRWLRDRALERQRWPAADRVGRSRATAPTRPLRLDGSRLYLDRYWREERRSPPTCSPRWPGARRGRRRRRAGRRPRAAVRRRAPTGSSAPPRRPRCCAGWRSWPGARAPARRRRSRGSSRCSTSRRPRPARRRR